MTEQTAGVELLKDARLRSSRQVAITATLLDSNDNPTTPLDGVTGGAVEFSATTTLRGSGTLNVADRGQPITWLNSRIKLAYTIIGVGQWPLGVWLLASPTMQHTQTGNTWQVGLLSKLTVLDQDCLPQAYSTPAGTNVTDLAQKLIEEAGENRIICEHSTKTLPAGMVWQAGTSRLKIINDLLDTINYWAVWVDTAGYYRIEPYQQPQQRPSMFTLQPGPGAVHEPQWDSDQDLASSPNRVIITGQERTDGGQPLVAVAENHDPSSPLSYENRGRWITRIEQAADATDQTTLNAQATRCLLYTSPSPRD